MYHYMAPATSEEQAGNLILPRHGVAPDGVCRAPFVAVGPVSSYLTFPPLLRCDLSGLFLLHFPWSRLHRALPGTLALRSPDFPRARPFGAAPATIRLTHQLPYFSYGLAII